MSQQKMSRAPLSLGLHRGWQTSLEMRVSKQGRVRREGPRQRRSCSQAARCEVGVGIQAKENLLVVNSQEVRDAGLGSSPDIQTGR